MEPSQWERVQVLFHEAVALPVAERAGYLAAHADEAAGTIESVRQMLEADSQERTPLESDLARLAEGVLEHPSSLRPGVPASLGPYRLLRVLGEGGMGVVYLAERTDLGSLAAIKVLRDGPLSPARRARFASEQRTLARLNHPSIAQLHDAESLPDGTAWLVMEFVEGVPLTDYCHEHETSLEGRLELLRGVCDAVQYAHGQAIIHRDLKPSNVLVKANGTVKLLDFGIAKHLEADDGDSNLTRTGLRLMTPAYASPEQLRGEAVGIRSDIYSLGVILYELLTDRLPFPPHRIVGEAGGLAPEAPERPSAVARGGQLPPGLRRRVRGAGGPSWSDLDVLCATAMHADPERRYPTVEALIRDIDHSLAGEPLEARPDAWGYRLSKFVRRNRAGVVASTLVLVLALGLSVFYAIHLAAARDAALVEATRAGRIQRFMLNLFEGGDGVAGPADGLRVSTLLERGIDEARSLEQEPHVQAELYRTLGNIHRKLGEFERADELLDISLTNQRVLFGAAHPEFATTLVAVGLLRMDQARFEEAEAAVRQGVEGLRDRLGREHPSSVEALAALGQVLESRGRYEEAIHTATEVVGFYRRQAPSSPECVDAIGQLADAHYYAGHFDQADRLNEEVLEGTRRIYGVNHPRVADVLINLGASQLDRGRYEEAESYYRGALELLTAFHGSEHFRSASGMTMLGRSLVYQQKFDEGVALLRRALVIQERVHGSTHPRVASVLNDLGSAALQQDDFVEAEASFRRTLDIYRVAYGDDHPRVATATSNLGSALMSQARYGLAEEQFRRAVAGFERALSPSHLSTAIARIKLGRSLLGQSRFQEAVRETLAGYEVVKAQSSPSVSWLRAARNDLVAAFEALGDPVLAAKYRAELQNARSGSPDG